MKYVALLRGINVGGNNKVDMKNLVTAMEKAGFKDVSTYINSGNVFFESNGKPADLIVSLQKLIASTFGLDLNIVLRDKANIDKLVKAVPADWTNDKNMKCDIMFLWDEYSNKGILDLLTIRSGIDTVSYLDGAVIWKIDAKDQLKSGKHKLPGTKLYKNMTIRNVNTLRKIQERMS